MKPILQDSQFKKRNGWLSRIMDKNDRETYNKVLKAQLEIDDKDHAISKLERTSNHNMREKLNQFKHELNPDEQDFAKACRLKYIKEEIRLLSDKIKKTLSFVEELKRKKISISDRMVYLEVADYQNTERQYQKYLREYVYLNQDKDLGQLTQNEIDNARTQPIEGLIEVNKRHMAKCVNHNDTTPSMYCRNNFAHCFSCSWTGDVIAVVMKILNLNFREAVKYLNR